jgi:hypothetical protein
MLIQYLRYSSPRRYQLISSKAGQTLYYSRIWLMLLYEYYTLTLQAEMDGKLILTKKLPPKFPPLFVFRKRAKSHLAWYYSKLL